MKERPILMTTESVKAILDGRKSQTRRVIKPQIQWLSDAWYWRHPKYDNGDGVDYFHSKQITDSVMKLIRGCCPHGQVGDRLWVRETWTDLWMAEMDLGDIIFKATPPNVRHQVEKWKPSMFMPRWASRITLEITGLRVERLQEISPVDCSEEGINRTGDIIVSGKYMRATFSKLWDSLNAKRGYDWETNPWVWVIGFKVVK